MGGPLSPEQLTDKIIFLENEINLLREELAALRQTTVSVKPQTTVSIHRTDKTVLQQEIDRLFKRLNIIGRAMGVDRVREMLAETSLEQNELSQSIIQMREE